MQGGDNLILLQKLTGAHLPNKGSLLHNYLKIKEAKAFPAFPRIEMDLVKELHFS